MKYLPLAKFIPSITYLDINLRTTPSTIFIMYFCLHIETIYPHICKCVGKLPLFGKIMDIILKNLSNWKKEKDNSTNTRFYLDHISHSFYAIFKNLNLKTFRISLISFFLDSTFKIRSIDCFWDFVFPYFHWLSSLVLFQQR